MGMHMTGGTWILSVPTEHLPGLVALLLMPLAAWLAVRVVVALAGRGMGAADRLRARVAGLPAGGKLALAGLAGGAMVHAAIVPTHWRDSRTLAVLFVVDAAALLGALLLAVAGWARWRVAAVALLAATTGGYILYLLLGWEAPDLVGLATTSLELAGALALALSDLVPARGRSRWSVAAAVPVAALALLGSAAVASSAQADAGATAGPSMRMGVSSGGMRAMGRSVATVSVATSSPAGAISWPLPSMSMEPGMQMVTPGCAAAPTAAQKAAAASLVDSTVSAIAKYRSLAAAEAAGYVPITPSGLRVVHYLNPAMLADGRILDPGAVESLVYANTAHGAVLVAAMYILPLRNDGMPPMPGGCLTEWHVHTNLCFSLRTGAVVGFAVGGTCRAGSINVVTPPMIHIWLAPVPGGPLAVDGSTAQIEAAADALPAPSPANGAA